MFPLLQATSQLQELEEERISQMQDFMNKYNSHLSVIGPKLIKVWFGIHYIWIIISEDPDKMKSIALFYLVM